jgi:hypothetical protein
MPIGDTWSSSFQPHCGIGAEDSISLIESLQSLNFVHLASKPHGKFPYRTPDCLEFGSGAFSGANDKVKTAWKLMLFQSESLAYSAFPKVS